MVIFLLYENAASNIEQVLKIAPHKAATVWPPTTHHEKYQNKTNKTCGKLLDEFISDVLLWLSSHGQAKAGLPAQTYIQQLSADT